jgi:hypothetical protein
MGCYEHSTEPSGSKNTEEFLDQLSILFSLLGRRKYFEKYYKMEPVETL